MKMVQVEVPEHIVEAVCRRVSEIKSERHITHSFAVQYALEHWAGSQVNKERKNAHTEHCCKICGCKYGDDDCPVAGGVAKQSYSCGNLDVCTCRL